MNEKRALMICGLVLIAGVVAGSVAGVRLNTTASLPMGFYQIMKGEIERGDVVLACPEETRWQREARDRGYLHFGIACPGGFALIFKRALGLPGDYVQVTVDGIIINGQFVPNTGHLMADSQGRPLPPLPKSGEVPPGMVWLISNYSKRSYDSRYFGPVPMNTVQGKATALWTFK